MTTREPLSLLVMRSAAHRFGVSLAAVERVYPSVQIRPIPGAPGAVCGIVNVHGSIAPVIDLSKRFAGSDTQPDLDSKLVCVRTPQRRVILLCREVEGVMRFDAGEITPLARHVPGAAALPSVALAGADLVYLYDPERLLLEEEAASIELALQQEA